MNTKEGILKVAAKRAGVEFDEYVKLIESGQKRCTRCKTWKQQADFGKDLSRSDGFASTCIQCRQHTVISKSLRRDQLLKGLKWCRGCADWVNASLINGLRGACKTCILTETKKRYANDPEFRYKRQQHAIHRKRGVGAVPVVGVEVLMEDFGGMCAYCCKSPATTWDHIIPVKAGGETVNGNMVPCCLSCNSSKKDQDLFEWLEKKSHPCHPKLVDVMALTFASIW